MANLLVEGWDWFPSGRTLAQREALLTANGMFQYNNYAPNVFTGRFGFGKGLGENALVTTTNSFDGQLQVAPLGEQVDEGFIGAAVFRAGITTSNMNPGLSFFDASYTSGGEAGLSQVYISFEKFGVIRVWRGTNRGTMGTFLGASVPGSFQDDEWFHAEVKSKIANSGGTVEVRINTVQVLELPSLDTCASGNEYFDSMAFGNCREAFVGTGNAVYTFDDMFCNDTTGSENNDWTGNVRVKGQFAIADGFTNNFAIGGTAPAATNWQSVLNNLLDDTKYVFSGTNGDIDLYTPDPNLNSPLVRVVQIRMALRQDDATQRSAKAILRLGSVNYEGSQEFFTNQTYTFYKERWQLNPATGVTFTGSEVNAAEMGVKVQS